MLVLCVSTANKLNYFHFINVAMYSVVDISGLILPNFISVNASVPFQIWLCNVSYVVQHICHLNIFRGLRI